MSCLDQTKQRTRRERRPGTVELSSEPRLCENDFNLAVQRSTCRKQRNTLLYQVGQFREDAHDFLEFRLMQSDQLVIQFENGEWFHEDRCAARRRAVNDALHASLLIRANRYYKAPIPHRDQLLLKLAGILRASQHRLELARHARPG